MQLGVLVSLQTVSIFVKLFQYSRLGGPGLLVAGGTLLLAFAGCGGGGTGSPTPIATNTPIGTPVGTPVATSVSAACNSLSYRPNYYGLPEPDSNDASDNIYNFWRRFPVTVYIPADANAADRTATLNGFDQWVNATGGRASYQLVSSASGANLVVSYETRNPSSDTLGLTTVSYNPAQHYIASARMELFFYTRGQVSNVNAANQSIAAHEFGHALGLSPHSPFEDDLMYPFLQADRVDVSTRDLNTLRTIYCDNFSTRSTSSSKTEGPLKTITIRN